MNKNSFYKILCSYTPEQLNEFLSQKGTQKTVNAITFIDEKSKYFDKETNKEDKKGKDN